MSDDFKLQKLNLGSDWIDLSYGEPKIITQSLFRSLNCFGNPFKMPSLNDMCSWEYPSASGNPELLSILEQKHDAKVVICNGAKQALAAALISISKNGSKTIWYDTPFYPANPGFTKDAGLTLASLNEADSVLITTPNNPDGKNYSNVELVNFNSSKVMIHDAAYYTDIYLPEDQIPIPVGDIQIFSSSKMYGLSGLRIGYAVIHNEKYYKDFTNFIEGSTAGVSVASQKLLAEVERFFLERPNSLKSFISDARESLILSRKELTNLDPEVMQPINTNANSMFAWCKIGPKLDYMSAKVYLLPGELFGQPGMVRMNIAQPSDIIREAVNRLNAHKIRS